ESGLALLYDLRQQRDIRLEAVIGERRVVGHQHGIRAAPDRFLRHIADALPEHGRDHRPIGSQRARRAERFPRRRGRPPLELLNPDQRTLRHSTFSSISLSTSLAAFSCAVAPSIISTVPSRTGSV